MPRDLLEISDSFNVKRKRGEAQAHGSGYGGSGFKFNSEEDELRNAERKVTLESACTLLLSEETAHFQRDRPYLEAHVHDRGRSFCAILRAEANQHRCGVDVHPGVCASGVDQCALVPQAAAKEARRANGEIESDDEGDGDGFGAGAAVRPSQPQVTVADNVRLLLSFLFQSSITMRPHDARKLCMTIGLHKAA